VVRLSQQWRADQTIIEITEMGRALRQHLKRSGPIRPILMTSRYDKEARFLAQSARFESGQVHVPTEAPWYADWPNDLLAFPNGRHDDQVDSTSQALNYLSSKMFPAERNRVPHERPKTLSRPAGFVRREKRKGEPAIAASK
jgi:predicted phage terminase large subunit-like protein